jgi:hypothetical protein
MFRPNWPSSGAQVVVAKEYTAHCKAVFFPPILVASGCFDYVGYRQFYSGVLTLQGVVFRFVL